MWISQPGKVVDGLDFLGTHGNCLYLLQGRDYMFIGGSMSYVAPSLEKQLAAMKLNEAKLKYLVISHSHFDHCGAVPYLKRKFPQLQIVASAYSQQVLVKEKVIGFLESANRRVIQEQGLQGEYDRLNLKFDSIKVDRVVKEGDVIDLGGGLQVKFLEVPGHTQCHIAVYVPRLKALFPADSAPFPIDDMSQLATPTPQYNFSAYKESLKKLVGLEVEICAFEHNGVALGEDARKVQKQWQALTEDFERHVVDLYRQTGDLDKTIQRIAAESMAKNKLPFLDTELWGSVSRAEVTSVLRHAKLLD